MSSPDRTAVMLEALYRNERARVLAAAIRVTQGDFELAEEAVHETFAAAAEQWHRDGLPQEPTAWLIRVARNKVIDAIRRRVKWRAVARLEKADAEVDEVVDDRVEQTIPDDRLRLIFTCCHPALAQEAQVALTLHTLCGLSTEEIARAFLLPTPTLAQRLVRAKNKIKTAKIPYEVPAGAALNERSEAVMAVLYLIFNEGYAATFGDDWVRRDLCAEAIRLARMLLDLAPSPEAKGLLALMLLQDARQPARTDAAGDLILLEHQDRSLWNRVQIDQALTLVPQALRGGAGSYALQAAIAALHANAKQAAETDWPQIAALYGELARRIPSAVIELNRAVAVAMCQGPTAGLAILEPLRQELGAYHLWHAARADLLIRLERFAEACDHYRIAGELATSNPERRFLTRRLAEAQARLKK